MTSEALCPMPHKQLELVHAWLVQDRQIINSLCTFLVHGGVETPRMLTAGALFARICTIDLLMMSRGRPALQTNYEQHWPYHTLAANGHVVETVCNTLLQVLEVRARASCYIARNAPYMLQFPLLLHFDLQMHDVEAAISEAAHVHRCQSGRQLHCKINLTACLWHTAPHDLEAMQADSASPMTCRNGYFSDVLH